MSTNSEPYHPIAATTLELLSQCLRDEGAIAAGVFGSRVESSLKTTSDIDLVVVRANDVPDVRVTDRLSRTLKRRLHEAGVTCLFAFNIYSREALSRAARERLWLIASIARRHLTLFDDENVIEPALVEARRSTVEIAPLAWRGAACPPNEVYATLVQQFQAAGTIVAPHSRDAAGWYQLEARRVEQLKHLRADGIYASRISLLDATRLVDRRKFSHTFTRACVHRDNFQHIMLGERVWFDYDQRAFHLKASNEFTAAHMPLLALRHSYAALRCELLRQLHEDGVPMLDGEVVQQWLIHHGAEIPESRRDELHEFGMQAEQVLGRAHVSSFDLDQNGEGVYDVTRPAPAAFYAELIDHVRNCTGWVAAAVKGRQRDKPQVTIIVPSYKRPKRLQRALASAQTQIMPPGSLEVIVVHDGPNDDVLPAPTDHRTCVTFLTAPRGGAAGARMFGAARAQGAYIAFVDDDVVLTPTWTLRVLQMATRDSTALVGCTLLSFPPSSFIEAYCDYRELLRQPVTDRYGRIVNIITAGTIIHRDALAGVGAMAPLHQRYCITGSDDVDFTWAVAQSGGRLHYASDALAFHEHRRSLRELFAQHVGYGEGAALHCLSRARDPNELSIPAPTMRGVLCDMIAYLAREVPARAHAVWQAERSITAAVSIPLLDAARRLAYNVGLYRGRRYVGVRA